MIKILLLAVVPFMTQHRNVVPKTEVSTNFYGSVTGIVDKAYIEARVGAGGGGGCDTNAVDILANSAVVTNAITVAVTNRVAALETATNNLSSSVSSLQSSKLDKTNSYTKAETDAKLAVKRDKDDLDVNEFGEHSVLAPECFPIIATGVDFSSYSIKDTPYGLTLCDAEGNERANFDRYDGKFYNSEPGLDIRFGGLSPVAGSFPYLLPDTLAKVSQLSTKADIMMISATNPTFSNAVLAVQISTNDFAALYALKEAFADLPIDPVTGGISIGALLAALAAAAAWLKKNKVGSFKSVGGATATVDNGVAKLDDFFTESNSLLNGTIDAEVISKGTAPDAHLEAPTDEHLKLILADSSVAYDSAKALPYKLTSVIGDRVVATMTLTAASTDITLPTISANDTTVKDFILDVTNAYAVEGVATDAGINIPRTDFKLVTRDGESLTDVTTVKAGKSAFICFTQKSPVVVDGTTYPCWCVIQLPFGDPS